MYIQKQPVTREPDAIVHRIYIRLYNQYNQGTMGLSTRLTNLYQELVHSCNIEQP